MQKQRSLTIIALAAAVSQLWGCAAPIDAPVSAAPAATSSAAPFALTIAHVNDHHSNLDPQRSTSLNWQGQTLQLETGGFARVAAQIAEIAARSPNTLKLHAGDAITGSLYYTLFAGEADAALMNHICFDAMALGNHEFDNGDGGLKTFLDFLAQGDCNTRALGANVKPEVGVSPLTPQSEWDSFQPYEIYAIGGEQVGVIGLDIAIKTKQSSQPDASTIFLDEVATAKQYIAELEALGVGKIILLTHYQYQNDLALARALPAVDAIIGGDSHTLLGDFSAYGLPSAGPYPTEVMNADGDKVCVAHAYEYAKVVGELVIDFNGDDVSQCGGRPHYLVSETAPAALAETGLFTPIAPQPTAVAIRDGFAAEVKRLSAQTIAQAPERICMQRSGIVTREGCGAARQSDMHALVSEAFMFSTPQADFALQNGGGVRADIPAGAISTGDIYRILPFDNTLVEVELTGAQVHQLLEQAVAYTLAPEGSDGAYPHGANIQFDVDLTATAGNRVSAVTVLQNNQWQPLQPEQRYIMVTNSFVANGSDGWVLLGELQQAGKVTDTYTNYAQALIDYVKHLDTVARPTQHSTQRFVPIQ